VKKGGEKKASTKDTTVREGSRRRRGLLASREGGKKNCISKSDTRVKARGDWGNGGGCAKSERKVSGDTKSIIPGGKWWGGLRPR